MSKNSGKLLFRSHGCYQVLQKFQNTPHIGPSLLQIIQPEMHTLADFGSYIPKLSNSEHDFRTIKKIKKKKLISDRTF
jgi:hypothetical protein